MSYNAGDVLGFKFDRRNCLGTVSLDNCLPESRSHGKTINERYPSASPNSLLSERRLVATDGKADALESARNSSIHGESTGRSSTPSRPDQIHPRQSSGRMGSLLGAAKPVEDFLLRDDSKFEPKASFEDSRMLSAGKFDILRLESLVLRMEAAIQDLQVIPSWVTTLLAEPAWCVRMRGNLNSEDIQKHSLLTPSTELYASPQSNLIISPRSTDSLWHEVPQPMDSLIRNVVADILPVIKEDVNKVLGDVLHEQSNAINGMGASSKPWSAEAAVAISEALLPYLQRPLAAEIADELSARQLEMEPRVRFRASTSVYREDVGRTEGSREPLDVSEVRPALRSQVSPGVRSYRSSTGSTESSGEHVREKQSYALIPSMSGNWSSRESGELHNAESLSRYRYKPQSRNGSNLSLEKNFSSKGSRSPITSYITGSDTFETHVSGLERLPQKAFVVNFQRLILMRKVFQVIHEFINSTVVASLTLVKVGNLYQFGTSLAFMACSFIIYTCHYWHYDTLEISDYKNLCELLGDDDDLCNGEGVDNPNRLIKALAFSRRGFRKFAIRFVNTFMFLCAVGLWTFFLFRYIGIVEFEFDPEEDKELTLTLLLVGSMVLMFHLLYEWLFWRETQCIMPPDPHDDSRPWDPREHGLPLGLRWFGLPSMWFTSEQSANHLRKWISKAKGFTQNRIVHSIYPQEIALLALEKDHSRSLTHVLRHAKLYDARTGDFFLHDTEDCCRPVKSDELPEELGIDLVYFDNFQHVRGQAGRGEFLQPEEQYQKTEFKRVTERGSLVSSEQTAARLAIAEVTDS